MVNFSNEFLLNIVRKYNNFEAISDDWQFVKEEVEKEQARLVQMWLGGDRDSEGIRSKIQALNWLVTFIERTVTQYPSAIEELKGRQL
jgi:hypothetical protein